MACPASSGVCMFEFARCSGHDIVIHRRPPRRPCRSCRPCLAGSTTSQVPSTAAPDTIGRTACHARTRRPVAARARRDRQQAIPGARRRARHRTSRLHGRSQCHLASVVDHTDCRAQRPRRAPARLRTHDRHQLHHGHVPDGADRSRSCAHRDRHRPGSCGHLHRDTVVPNAGHGHDSRVRRTAQHRAGRPARLVGRGQRCRPARDRAHHAQRLHLRQGGADVLAICPPNCRQRSSTRMRSQ